MPLGLTPSRKSAAPERARGLNRRVPSTPLRYVLGYTESPLRAGARVRAAVGTHRQFMLCDSEDGGSEPRLAQKRGEPGAPGGYEPTIGGCTTSCHRHNIGEVN